MTPNEYQRAAMRTAPQQLSLAEAALGMATEASEAADVLKKHLFQGHPLDTEKLKKEMGDALWYMAYVCHMVDGLDLEGVMEDNIKKLQVRFPDGFTPEASIARADEDKAEICYKLECKTQFHYRLQRGGLAESLLTERAFRSKEEMVQNIFDDVIPTLDICYTVIGLDPYIDELDRRIGGDDWEYTTIITAAVYDPYANRIYKNNAFGFCNAKVTEREWYWYHRNTNTIRKICPDDYPGMALGAKK